jgi:hypothetical protein
MTRIKLSILDQLPIISSTTRVRGAGHAGQSARAAAARLVRGRESMVITITGDYATRARSYELVAGAFDLSSR